MNSPTGIFSVLYNLKPDSNSSVFSGYKTQTPYPPIIVEPNVGQVFKNWNRSETAFMIMAVGFSAFFSRRAIKKIEGGVLPYDERVSLFKAFFNTYILMSLCVALRNSYWRLQGYVPNGLEWQQSEKQIPPIKKYDYTSSFLKNTFWKNLSN